MTVSRKISKWRAAQNISQRQAAAKAGVSQATWSALETGDFKRIGLDVVRKIVRACGGAVTFDDFASDRRRSVPPARAVS